MGDSGPYSSSGHLKGAWKLHCSITRKCIQIDNKPPPTKKHPLKFLTTKFPNESIKYDKNQHTCLQDDTPPNMGAVLLLPHPCIVPSPNESSNEEPVFGRGEVHIEECWGRPIPNTRNIYYFIACKFQDHRNDILNIDNTANSELSTTPTIFSRSASEMDSSFSTSFPFTD